MAGQAFSQILNPLSLQPGLHLIDGQDVQQIVNQNNSGQGQPDGESRRWTQRGRSGVGLYQRVYRRGFGQ